MAMVQPVLAGPRLPGRRQEAEEAEAEEEKEMGKKQKERGGTGLSDALHAWSPLRRKRWPGRPPGQRAPPSEQRERNLDRATWTV